MYTLAGVDPVHEPPVQCVERLVGEARSGQPEGHEGESVPLILMIHDAADRAMRKALAMMARLNVVKEKPVMIRVESFE